MLFIYLIAAVMAGLVSYGSIVLFGLGLEEDLLRDGNLLAMFVLTMVSTGALVAVWFLLKAAYDELVYWDFHTDIAYHVRKAIWELTQKLSKEYVVSVHWTGYYTDTNLGMGAHLVEFHTWWGTTKGGIE